MKVVHLTLHQRCASTNHLAAFTHVLLLWRSALGLKSKSKVVAAFPVLTPNSGILCHIRIFLPSGVN